jgi:hypothetical protein
MLGVLHAVPTVMAEMQRVHTKCLAVTERVAAAKADVEDNYQRSVNTVEDTMTKYLQQLQSRRVALLSALQEELQIKLRLLDEQDATLREIMASSRQSFCVARTLQSHAVLSGTDAGEACGSESSSSDHDGGDRDLVAGGTSAGRLTGSSDSSTRGPGNTSISSSSLVNANFSGQQQKKKKKRRLPCNTTPSVLCDIGAGISDLVQFSSAQRLDTAACVDTKLSVAFARLEQQFFATVVSLGDLHVIRSRGRMFPYSGDPSANDGVLAYLGCDRGIKIYQNPVHRGLVKVTSSGVGYGRLENFVAAERSEFCTTEPPTRDHRSYVTVVLEAPVVVTHYRIGHDTYDTTGHFLRSWELQGRNTTNSSKGGGHHHHHQHQQQPQSSAAQSPAPARVSPCVSPECESQDEGGGGWIVLDAKTNSSAISAASPLRVFQTLPDIVEHRRGCSELRLVMTGPNSDQSHHLMATAFEVYGELLGL